MSSEEILPEERVQGTKNEFVAMLPLSRPPVIGTEMGNILEKSGLRTHYPEFRTWRDETQKHCVVRAVQGDSLIVQLPTGYGKSFTALLPAVVCGGLTVIVAPTTSLIGAMYSHCFRGQIHASIRTGSSSHDEQKLAIEALLFLQGGILIVTPQKAIPSSFQSVLSLLPVTWIVFDEAHYITSWRGWRSAYKFISNWLIPVSSGGVPVTFLSAIFSSFFHKQVPEITGRSLTHFTMFFKSPMRPNICLKVEKAPSKKISSTDVRN